MSLAPVDYDFGELEKVTALFNERSSRAGIVPAKTCFCAQDAFEKSCCD